MNENSLRRAWLALFSCAATTSLACNRPQGDQVTGTPTWRIIDSMEATPWNEMAESMTRYTIEVSSAVGLDTVAQVSELYLLNAGPGILAGVRTVDSSAQRQLFRLRTGRHRLDVWPAPSDVAYFYHDLAMSANGRWLAYLARDSTGVYATVRDLAAGTLLFRGPRATGCPCDTDPNHARWLTRDSFEVAAMTDDEAFSGWIVSAGNVATRHFVSDSVANEPTWHDQ